MKADGWNEKPLVSESYKCWVRCWGCRFVIELINPTYKNGDHKPSYPKDQGYLIVVDPETDFQKPFCTKKCLIRYLVNDL